MILADTSVWIDHFRKPQHPLTDQLVNQNVAMHDHVLGELACGNLHDRENTLNLLSQLPRTSVAEPEEVLFFIKENQLHGRGIGLVDAHLLASTALTPLTRLWTQDKRLAQIAQQLDIHYLP